MRCGRGQANLYGSLPCIVVHGKNEFRPLVEWIIWLASPGAKNEWKKRCRCLMDELHRRGLPVRLSHPQCIHTCASAHQPRSPSRSSVAIRTSTRFAGTPIPVHVFTIRKSPLQRGNHTPTRSPPHRLVHRHAARILSPQVSTGTACSHARNRVHPRLITACAHSLGPMR